MHKQSISFHSQEIITQIFRTTRWAIHLPWQSLSQFGSSSSFPHTFNNFNFLCATQRRGFGQVPLKFMLFVKKMNFTWRRLCGKHLNGFRSICCRWRVAFRESFVKHFRCFRILPNRGGTATEGPAPSQEPIRRPSSTSKPKMPNTNGTEKSQTFDLR